MDEYVARALQGSASEAWDANKAGGEVHMPVEEGGDEGVGVAGSEGDGSGYHSDDDGEADDDNHKGEDLDTLPSISTPAAADVEEVAPVIKDADDSTSPAPVQEAAAARAGTDVGLGGASPTSGADDPAAAKEEDERHVLNPMDDDDWSGFEIDSEDKDGVKDEEDMYDFEEQFWQLPEPTVSALCVGVGWCVWSDDMTHT
jgi:hypothetical protein